jgi:hypothetical protein
MKTSRASLVATAVPLLLTSLPLAAAELPFNAPVTARAQESAQLLHDAARALGDLPAGSTLVARNEHISNLWIFPTADADTVLAQYDLVSNQEGPVSAKHLTVLTLRGHSIVEQTELPDRRGEDGHPTAATPHWSALIGTGAAAAVTSPAGTGHASNTGAAPSSHGVPATPHWTAQIGAGTAASSVSNTETRQPSSSDKRSTVADVHWTARIGTGHATESNVRERT